MGAVQTEIQNIAPPELLPTMPRRKIALVHDYLIQDGGAERVLGALQDMFPRAPTFVLLHDARHQQAQGKNIRSSFINYLPFSQQLYQWYMPLMPMAAEQLDFTGFDLVISSSSSFIKGIIVPPEAKHVCYCHTPTRFLWQERLSYVNDLKHPRFMRMLLPPLFHSLRQWDRLAAERPTHLLTNSQTSQERIRRYYGREAEVIYPPVDVERIPLSTAPGEYWLAGGRLVGYKRFDLIVQAFAKLRLPLKIFGAGPEYSKLKSLAAPETEFTGYISDAEKIALYGKAIGFLHPQMEDFGITAVEAMAAGKPVLTYGRGGGAETIVPGETGEFLEAQSWENIADAVMRFNPAEYDPNAIRRRAEQFSKARFQERLTDFLSRI
jgi:glycosyltransferase involved in cell wall biosynthesis